MSRSQRRSWVVPVGWMALLVWPALTPAEDARRPDSGQQVVPFSAGISLPVDGDLARKLDTLPELIHEKDWAKVTRFLQGLLDAPQDAFFPIRDKGDEREIVRWTTVRAEASRLLGNLPADGLAFYDFSYGQQARALLKEAEEQRDPQLLAVAAQRFPHTRAGIEALERLATLHLDRGRTAMAALCFARLLAGAGAERCSALTLFKAVQAFEHSGDRAEADRAWKQLAARVPDGLRLGSRTVSLDELRQVVARPEARSLEAVSSGETLFRGDASRDGRASGPFPALTVAWQQPTCAESMTRVWLTEAVHQCESRSQPVLPAFFSILAGDRLVCRTQGGIHAIDRSTGKTAWVSPSSLALDTLVREEGAHVTSWISSYLSTNPQALVENSVLGTLSTDGERVYAVEDFPFPPYPTNYAGFISRAGQKLELSLAPDLTEKLYHSRLVAIDVVSGKELWEVGGPRQEPSKEVESETSMPGAYFLGPPLPLGGKLYGLVEQDQDLRLVCLEPATGAVAWTQTLGVVRNRLVVDGGRRMQAAPLACSEGILVCPTNAGAVFGIDLLTHSLLWAHCYREETPEPIVEMPFRGRFRPVRPNLPQAPPHLAPHWKAAAPILNAGKVLLAAPDDPAIHCLSLHDGSSLWKAEATDGCLAVAGAVGGRALLIGSTECRALDLENGKTLWKRETGTPLGLGVLGEDVYYLPMTTSNGSKGRQVCAIDLERGVIRDRQPAPAGAALGNLLLHDGEVFAQTATTITAFRRTVKGP